MYAQYFNTQKSHRETLTKTHTRPKSKNRRKVNDKREAKKESPFYLS